MMRSAVVINDIDLENPGKAIRKVFLFDYEKETITPVGNERFISGKLSYLTIWLKGKKVDKVYIDDTDQIITSTLERAGFIIGSFETLRKNLFIKSLIEG